MRFNWVSVKDELPPVGLDLILFSNGVVQNAIYARDEYDNDYSTGSFWVCTMDRDISANIDWENDYWSVLPEPPKSRTED